MKILHEVTLFDAIESHEQLLSEAVHHAVFVALRDLGDDIKNFEWASMSAKVRSESCALAA